jgi:hypothetical protein
METHPNFNMYAVLKDDIIVNIGFGININFLIDFNSNPILNSEQFEFIQMTPENSPAELGMKYNGKTFSY